MKYSEIKNLCDTLNCKPSDLRELCNKIEDGENDFYTEIDGNEYRFIADYAIWDIYVESMEELVKECYLGGMTDVPWWLAIDWKQTAKNVLNSDGYGNHFATYDGDENEALIDGTLFHIFRTN